MGEACALCEFETGCAIDFALCSGIRGDPLTLFQPSGCDPLDQCLSNCLSTGAPMSVCLGTVCQSQLRKSCGFEPGQVNCGVVFECLQNCDEDSKCQFSCFASGDRHGLIELLRFTDCITSLCTDQNPECTQAAFEQCQQLLESCF